jgi:hypothetical protein
MPIVTPEYIAAVCAYLRGRGLPNAPGDARAWVRRLARPLYRGARVDALTVLRGPMS